MGNEICQPGGKGKDVIMFVFLVHDFPDVFQVLRQGLVVAIAQLIKELLVVAMNAELGWASKMENGLKVIA